MKRIFLVRHAETFSNTGEHFDHPQRIRLTDKGHQESKNLVKKVKKPKKIFVSKYFRTLETAQYTIDKYKGIDVGVLPEAHEFTYISHNKFKDSNGRLNLIHDYWNKLDPDYNDGDNSESFIEYLKRLNNTISYLKKLKVDGNIYVFTHGNFSRGFLLLNIEFKNLFKDKKNFKKNIKKMMQRFKETYNSKQYQLSNTEIVEVTDLVKKY